jgi:proteasome lid subunit RPN8/RPN11
MDTPCASDDQEDIIALGPVELTESPWKASLPGIPPFMQNDLQILVHNKALDNIWRHAGGEPDREVAGILLGDTYQDENTGILFVEIQQSFALSTVETGLSFVRFNHDVWTEVDLVCKRLFPSLKKLGWYHSHPGFGLFLSRDDIQVHTSNFPMPWHVALVVDSVAGTYAFFRWQRDQQQLAWQPQFCQLRNDLISSEGEMWQAEFEPRVDDVLIRQILALQVDLEHREKNSTLIQTLGALRERLTRQRRERSGTPTKQDILLTLMETLVALIEARDVAMDMRSRGQADQQREEMNQQSEVHTEKARAKRGASKSR